MALPGQSAVYLFPGRSSEEADSMRLGAEDANGLLHLIGALHHADSTEELAATCRAGLAALIPADTHDIVVVGSTTPGEDSYLGTPGGYNRAERDCAMRLGQDHPVVAHFARAGDCGPRRVSDLMSLGQWRETEFYRHINLRLAQDFEIDAILPGGTATGMAGLAITRSDRDFDERDRALLAHLRHPLGMALGRLRARERRRRVAARHPHEIEASQLSRAFPGLTAREAEVLHWILAGKRDGEIALILGMRPATATTHVRNLLAKLGVDSRLAAAMRAVAACALP